MSETGESLIHATSIAEIREWLRTARGGDVAFIRGEHPGMGITTLLHRLLDDDFEAVWVSTGRSKLKHLLIDAASSAISPTMRRKVLVLDPVDALFSDPSVSPEISEFARQGSKVPIVCAGFRMRFSTTRADDIFKRDFRIARILVPAIDPVVAVRHLRAIAETRGSHDVDVRAIWKAAQGDMRSATSALAAGTALAVKDEVCDGIDAITRLLTARDISIDRAMDLQDGDMSVVSMGVHENYPMGVTSVDVCASVADLFSIADLVDEAIYGRQQWDLVNMYAALTAGGPAALMQNEPVKAVAVKKFGSVWSRGNNLRSKEKVIRLIAEQTQAHNCTRLDVTDIAFVRGMLLNMAKAGRFDDMAKLASDVFDDTGVLGIIRLFESKAYTQTIHTKYKRAAASCGK
jgi:hypothetical protein